MDHNDRQFIMTKLKDGQKHESIAHDLLMRRALEEVESVAKDVASNEARTKWMMEQRYYTFLAPQPEPIITKQEGNVELVTRPNRQEYRVHCLDLPAFCKELGLDLKQMERVARGEIRDHKDWMVCWTGGSMDVGRAWKDPTPALRDEEARQNREKVEGKVWRKESVYTPDLPMVDWRPTQS
jgi:hypothetical protein